MRIKIKKDHKGLNKGVEVELDPLVARSLIERGIASEVKGSKPKSKRVSSTTDGETSAGEPTNLKPPKNG